MNALFVLLCGCPRTFSTKTPVSEKKEVIPQELRITSTGAGMFKLGEPLPIDPDLDGYYASTSLYQQPVTEHELVVLLSPKENVYHVLVGPKYATERGVRVGTTFAQLESLYPDIFAGEQEMGSDFVTRPDHIDLDETFYSFTGARSQRDRRDLTCSMSSADLPNVSFFFESCPSGAPESKDTVAAIMLTHPDEGELAHVDPILDFERVLPCPQSRTENPKQLAQLGEMELSKNKMGDYFSTGSVRTGLPMLRNAAISGSVEAAWSYAGMINLYVHQEYIGDPLQRPMEQSSQEALLFTLIATMRSEAFPDSCEELLLKEELELSEGVFSSTDDADPEEYGPCQDDYRFQIIPISQIEHIRRQARAWAACWDEQ